MDNQTHTSLALSVSLSPEPCRLKWGNSEWSQIISAVLFHIWLSFYGYIFNLLHKSVLAHECYSHLMFHFHIYFVFHICFSCLVGSIELKQYMSWSLFSTFCISGFALKIKIDSYKKPFFFQFIIVCAKHNWCEWFS